MLIFFVDLPAQRQIIEGVLKVFFDQFKSIRFATMRSFLSI